MEAGPTIIEVTPAALASVFLLGGLAAVLVGVVAYAMTKIGQSPMDAYPSELEDDSIH